METFFPTIAGVATVLLSVFGMYVRQERLNFKRYEGLRKEIAGQYEGLRKEMKNQNEGLQKDLKDIQRDLKDIQKGVSALAERVSGIEGRMNPWIPVKPGEAQPA